MAVRIKLQRRGGWRVATGRIPAAPATALTLTVPAAETEVRVSGISDRGDYETTTGDEQIVTALGADRELRIEWRPKVAEGQVDRSLSVESEAVLDVQEDGLRLIWRLNLQFPRSRRNTFSVSIPAEYLVEKIVGDNVRGWQVQPDDDRQAVEVTLLDEAADRETVTLHLSRRGAIEPDDATLIEAPAVLVEDAALHKGRLTIRRSPLLELRIDNVSGLPRTDVSAEAVASVQEGGPAQESPLGLRPYQAYEFSSTPFTVSLTATPVAGETSASVQTLVRIAERETTLESQVILNVRRRPVYRVRVYVPETLKLDQVSAPGDFDWAVTDEQGRRLLSIYLAAGQKQPFKVQIHGSLGHRQAVEPVPAPKLEVLDVTRQQGDMAVQIDPAFDVKAVGLSNCETILRDRVFGWLQADQRPLVPLALRYETPDYEATFEITARQAQVSGYTVTNVKVTDVAIEETIIVDLTIREAGIREVSFLLPDWMAKARTNAPMLRQKTVEDAGDGWKRIRLELQDEITGQYRVLVENDRLLVTTGVDESELPEAPIPVVETGRIEGRYVTLENAGRDELVVADQTGLEPLNRQQSQWRRLAAILGEGITTAYIVQGNAAGPSVGPAPAGKRLSAKLSFKTKQRKTVETAGAQIGLAETLLVVDASGAYRGRQTYHVNNTTEQFLEILLPESSRLWTATVAGEPVKPTEVPGGQSPNQVRIPLIKTAEGDRDYPVVLKYGGDLDPVGTLRQVSFPLIHTVNINVELSQVRLRLPETHRWYDFGGTMRQVYEEGTFKADFLLYNTKQVKRLRQVLSGDNTYAKLRSANNLKQIGLALQRYEQTNGDYLSNADFNKNYNANTAAVVDAQKQAQEFLVEEGEAAAAGNRDRLNAFWMMQDNGLARNVVTDLNPNFTVTPATQEKKPQAGDETFNKWLAGNQLERKTKQSKKEIESRLQVKMPQRSIGGKLKGLAADQKLLSGIATSDEQAEGEQQMRQSQSRGRVLLGSQKDLTREYQQQLEKDNMQLGQQRQTLRNARGYFSRRGEMAGVAEQSAGRSGRLLRGVGAAAYSADGRQMAEQPPGSVDVLAVEPQLSSLDVDLPERGTEFLFTTPRGKIEITALPISAPLASRLARLLGIVVAVLVLAVAYRFLRRIGRWLAGSKLGAALLFLAGLFSLLFALFPIAGLVALVVGIVQLVRLSITNRRRKLERAQAAA